ncbi:MAG: hypothetical protein EON90_05345 [Brevundimonas sp.]|nr:MAG: hypothetical protein EON90_05345 [Brevundimonas sp.]
MNVAIGRQAPAQAYTPPVPGARPTRSGSTETAQAGHAVVQAPTPLGSPALMSTAGQARLKLDADYASARAAGTRAVTDTSNGGRFLDLSALDDEELAAVALNAEGLFRRDEGIHAQAELGQRAKASLAPFTAGLATGDCRAYQTGIQQLYKAMSPAVRSALGWDQNMIDASKRLVARGEDELGPLDEKSFLQKFIEHLRTLRREDQDRTLDVDLTLFGFDDRTPSTEAEPRSGVPGTPGGVVDLIA